MKRKKALYAYMFLSFKDVCSIFRSFTTSALTESITVDVWSSALEASMLGVTWNFVYEHRHLKSVPVSTLNMGNAEETGELLRHFVDEVLKDREIIGSPKIRIQTISNDNEASKALYWYLMTNYVGSVLFLIHTTLIWVQDVFKKGTPWKAYMDHVDLETSFSSIISKQGCYLSRKIPNGMKRDIIQLLKHEITRWNSLLGAMI